MSEVVQKAIKSQALELVGQHRAAGDELVIVTATNEFVTRPIADAFGVSELIAVELERDAHGHLTGEIRGTPSAREGKVTRMEQWLSARNLGWDDVHTTFYTVPSMIWPCWKRRLAPSPPTRTRACGPWPPSADGAYLTCFKRRGLRWLQANLSLSRLGSDRDSAGCDAATLFPSKI